MTHLVRDAPNRVIDMSRKLLSSCACVDKYLTVFLVTFLNKFDVAFVIFITLLGFKKVYLNFRFLALYARNPDQP